MDLEKIKRLMKKKGYGYTSLSRKTGIDRTAIWKIVNGKTTDPRLETIKTIASALDVRVEDIILQDY